MAELKGISSDFSTGGECQDCYFKFIQYDLTPTENEKLEETTVSLNLPVDSVINIMGNDFAHYSGSFFEVPEGKILQLVGIINPTDAIGVNSDSVELHVSRLQQGQRTYVCEIGYIFSEYSRIGINNDQFHNSFFSFVMYDLGASEFMLRFPARVASPLNLTTRASLLLFEAVPLPTTNAVLSKLKSAAFAVTVEPDKLK